MKIINILPRQSKKTISALDILSKKLTFGVIIVPTERHKQNMLRVFDRTMSFIDGNRIREKIITPEQAHDWFNGKIIDTIIFDDIFDISPNDFIGLRENLMGVNGGAINPMVNIIAFGTMEEQIPMEAINIIKEHKAVGGQLDVDLFDDLIEYSEQDVKNWYYSFLTDLDTTIVIGPGTLAYMDHELFNTYSLNMPFK